MPTIARAEATRLYRWMRTARRIDEMERELVARGEAFFHVSGAGHEASAALAPHLHPDDYLHCHYRDKALLLARGLPLVEFFDSLLCNAASHSSGRQMSAHLSARALNVLSLVGPVGNNALQAAGIAHHVKDAPRQPIVLCAMGDGTTQQGEVLEAIAEAVRWTLPVLFLVEDNRYSISTRTRGGTFYSTPSGDADAFYGLPIQRTDGRDPAACAEAFGKVVRQVRTTRGPALCVMAVERLADHSNADDEAVYRDADEIRTVRATADPVARLRFDLLALGVGEQEIEGIDAAIDGEVRAAAAAALEQPAPRATHDAKMPVAIALTDRAAEYRGADGPESIAMGAAMRAVLAARMTADSRVSLYGEDIEDPKGDVFGVTRGLTTAFPGRVLNSPLSEATIMGTCIGRALAGGRPVAFIQFADFLPLAFNQIATELGSLAWRTQGTWTAPVIVIAACGAYRPGLGPFHAGTHEAALAHVPGIDVAMPSTAADSVGMLNAAFASERPTVLLYPKALLNDQARGTSADVARQFVPLGVARIVRPGSELTLVGWGNTVPLCEHVAATLAAGGVAVEVIDLRWLSPWDRDTVCASVRKTGRLLVVHEDTVTAGFGAEVIAAVSETLDRPIQCRRIARPDTYVPCHFGNQLEILPSYRSILTAAAAMCGLDVTWDAPRAVDAGRQVVTAIGSSPADQTVELTELHVRVGDAVHVGQTLASLEADKAIVDLASPSDGVVEAIHLALGARVAVDAPLLTLAVALGGHRQARREEAGVAHLRRRAAPAAAGARTSGAQTVVIAGLAAVPGRARLGNVELAARLKGYPAGAGGGDGILQRTGIESRLVADGTQDAVSMAVEAAAMALAEVAMDACELSLVICTTSTPPMISPSTACHVLQRLAPDADIAAYDLQAACSGYLYALAAAWDYLQGHAGAKVMVLTTETMRRIVDVNDPDTSPIFADAATATILTTAASGLAGLAALHRPVISARGDDGSTLRVPLPREGACMHMDGKRIFAKAVRQMSRMLSAACSQSGLTLADLDLVVPHQANGRIIEAMRMRLKLAPERIWNDIRLVGNTSSSSIPLALDTILRRKEPMGRIGLCAFGAGFTFGGAILDRTGRDAAPHPSRSSGPNASATT
jgi:2-oxoisovalerate dehydrogenase E1 component